MGLTLEVRGTAVSRVNTAMSEFFLMASIVSTFWLGSKCLLIISTQLYLFNRIAASSRILPSEDDDNVISTRVAPYYCSPRLLQ